MKTIRKLYHFSRFVWRNWYYKGVDKWHPWKYRISIKTAWEVAKIIVT